MDGVVRVASEGFWEGRAPSHGAEDIWPRPLNGPETKPWGVGE